MNDAFWSVCAMPIGLLTCFTPVLIAWVLKEMKEPARDKSDKRR
jgi:hypothetical protein